MPTSVINWRLWLDQDHKKELILKHIHGLIRTYKVCGIKDEREWEHFYDIIILDPVMTRHFSPFQLMWPHLRSGCWPFQELWAAFRSYMGQMFEKTHNQMNILRWHNPHASSITVAINRKPPQGRSNAPASVSLGMVTMIWGHRLSHQGASSISQAPSWPLDHYIGVRKSMRMILMRTGRILECWAVEEAVLVMAMRMKTARVMSPCRAVRMGPGKRREQLLARGNGRWPRTGRGTGRWRGRQWKKGRGRGSGRGRGNGKGLLYKPQGEMISLVMLLYSCRRDCSRRTWTRRAT